MMTPNADMDATEPMWGARLGRKGKRVGSFCLAVFCYVAAAAAIIIAMIIIAVPVAAVPSPPSSLPRHHVVVSVLLPPLPPRRRCCCVVVTPCRRRPCRRSYCWAIAIVAAAQLSPLLCRRHRKKKHNLHLGPTAVAPSPPSLFFFPST